MLRPLIVFGTRPEAIKLAPVIKEFEKYPAQARIKVCVTAQHREMLDQVLTLFDIDPDFDLDIMQERQSLPDLTANIMRSITHVIGPEPPDVLIVQGDTTTAAVAALAAFYHKVPVAHVEAGLRTYDPLNPYPEEINRRIISVLASYHFAPTKRAMDALLREGTAQDRVFMTGNTVVDALSMTLQRPCALDLAVGQGRRLILVTAHRRENFGQPLENICRAISEIVRRNPDVEVVYPVHLNPNVQDPVRRLLDGHDRIHLIAPSDYLAFAHLMAEAYIILTDSGGIQEEAPFMGKPVLVMRQETERPEAIEAGTARLVGTDWQDIVAETEKLLWQPSEYERMAKATSPFGDGRAAERIVRVLLSRLDPTPLQASVRS